MPSTMLDTSRKPAGLLCVVILATLTGCVGYVEGSHPRNTRHARIQPTTTVVVVDLDDYVYYPGYQVYYGSRTRRFYSMEGSSWVARPAPAHVSVEVLLSSPSVAVDFRDDIAKHHSRVVRTYPKSWAPKGRQHDRRQDQRKDSKKRKPHEDRH